MYKFKDPTEFIYKLAQPQSDFTNHDAIIVEENLIDRAPLFLTFNNSVLGKLKAPILLRNNEKTQKGIISNEKMNSTPGGTFNIVHCFYALNDNRVNDYSFQINIVIDNPATVFPSLSEIGIGAYIYAEIKYSKTPYSINTTYVDIFPLYQLRNYPYDRDSSRLVKNNLQENCPIYFKYNDLIKNFEGVEKQGYKFDSIQIKVNQFKNFDFSSQFVVGQPLWAFPILMNSGQYMEFTNAIVEDEPNRVILSQNLAYGYQIGVDLWQEVMDKIKAFYPQTLPHVGTLLADEITKRYHNDNYFWAANFENEYDGEAEVLRKVDSFLSHNKDLEKQITYYTGIDYSLNYFEDTTHEDSRDKTTENNLESVQNSTTTGDTSKTTTDNSSTSQSGTDNTTQAVNHTVEFDLLNSSTEDVSRAETTTTDTTRTPQLSGTSESTVQETGTDKTINDTTQTATDKGTENESYNSTEHRTGNNRNWDEIMQKVYELNSPLTRAAIEFGTLLIRK